MPIAQGNIVSIFFPLFTSSNLKDGTLSFQHREVPQKLASSTRIYRDIKLRRVASLKLTPVYVSTSKCPRGRLGMKAVLNWRITMQSSLSLLSKIKFRGIENPISDSCI